MNKNIQKNHKPQRILEVRTSQTGVLKQVFERISTVISDCCIVFIPPDKTYDQSQDDDYYEKIDTNPSKEKKGKFLTICMCLNAFFSIPLQNATRNREITIFIYENR